MCNLIYISIKVRPYSPYMLQKKDKNQREQHMVSKGARVTAVLWFITVPKQFNKRTLTDARMIILFFGFMQTTCQIAISLFITPNTVNFPQSLGHISWCKSSDPNVLEEMKKESLNSKSSSIPTHILEDHEKYTSRYGFYQFHIFQSIN